MRYVIFCTVFMLACGVFSYGQNVDSIINNYVKAIGGKEKLASVKTLHVESSTDQGGIKIPITINAIHQKALKQTFSFGGMTGYDIMTDTSGWFFSPFNGMQQPETKTTEDWKSRLPDLDLQGPLFDYKAKGYEARFVEKDDVDGVDCYVILLNMKNNVSKKYYIDPSSYYIIKETTKSEVDGREQVSSTIYSNYKLTDAGIVVPFSQDSFGQITTIDKLVTNGPIDLNIFKRSSN